MQSNRGQYNSSPMYDLKSRQAQEKRRQAQEAQSRDTPREFRMLSLFLSLVVPVFFLVCLLVQNNAVRWAFLIVTALALALMWVLRAFVKSARSSLTAVHGALMLIIALSIFIYPESAPEQPSRIPSPDRMDQGALFAQTDASNVQATLIGYTSQLTPAPEQETDQQPMATADPAAPSPAQTCLDSFFAAWSQNAISDMLTYCSPSWVHQQSSPNSALFSLSRNFHPYKDPVYESITGSDSSSSRIVTIKAYMLEGTQETVRRMHVMLQQVNSIWYVDPNSLSGVLVDEAAEAAAAENRVFIGTTIAPPTPTPEGGGSGITVYYNEQGGKYYHANRTCTAVDSQYWPLKEFSFDLINSQQFKSLLRCPKCNPPSRPDVNR